MCCNIFFSYFQIKSYNIDFTRVTKYKIIIFSSWKYQKKYVGLRILLNTYE